MPTATTVPAVEKKAVKPEASGSSGDVNHRGHEHWHLDDPHRKALAALVYTSLLKGAWSVVARSAEPLWGFLHASNRRALPNRAEENSNATA